MASYESGRVPPIVVGDGGWEQIGLGAGLSGAATVALVLDGAVAGSGYERRVTASLGAAAPGLRVERHVVPPTEPTAASVDAVAEWLRSLPAPYVVGVGGGTALDTAKQAAVAATGSAGIEHYALCAHPLPGRLPMAAVPTTSGTGAEVTRTCIVTDRAGRKVWTWGDELLPDLVVLDPVATASMPAHVTAATGLDAFVHALEAVSGRRRSALVEAPALHSLWLVGESLRTAVADGSDLSARQAMQEAALLAGVAIDGGGTGIAHSIGHALGTLAHVPHGVSVALGLDVALRWNVAGAPDAFRSAARAVGRRVDDLAAYYEQLLHDVDFGRALGRLPEPDISVAAIADAMVAPENLPMYTNNCRAVDDTDRHHLAEQTLARWHELRVAP